MPKTLWAPRQKHDLGDLRRKMLDATASITPGNFEYTWVECNMNLVRGGFQPRLPTSLPPPGQQQQSSPLPRRQPVPLMPPAQLHPGAPQVVAPAPAVPLQSPPPSELMDVDPSAGPPSQAVAVQPVLQPLSLGTPKESDTAAPCPAPTQQPSTQRQETLPLFVGPDAPSRPVPEAAPVVTVGEAVRGSPQWELRAPVQLRGPPPGVGYARASLAVASISNKRPAAAASLSKAPKLRLAPLAAAAPPGRGSLAPWRTLYALSPPRSHNRLLS
ncbi:vegetative cell wall protein gp1-like [Schistocerca americana]|uniref:vegetative cell wall protein gp1-like n=1 Tax=Schistocerca americana TaxID=7009 RepID=UPI001F4FB1F8|nr:vegetative cell wall protein gp1-like [Schistocerca americana]